MSNEIVPRKELNNQLLKGVGGIGGGIGLWILAGAGFWPGIILSGLVVFAGLGMSRSKKDRLGGLIAIGAGALGILAQVFPPAAVPLLVIGGIGLVVAGGISLAKFIKNMSKRT